MCLILLIWALNTHICRMGKEQVCVACLLSLVWETHASLEICTCELFYECVVIETKMHEAGENVLLQKMMMIRNSMDMTEKCILTTSCMPGIGLCACSHRVLFSFQQHSEMGVIHF